MTITAAITQHRAPWSAIACDCCFGFRTMMPSHVMVLRLRGTRLAWRQSHMTSSLTDGPTCQRQRLHEVDVRGTRSDYEASWPWLSGVVSSSLLMPTKLQLGHGISLQSFTTLPMLDITQALVLHFFLRVALVLHFTWVDAKLVHLELMLQH